MLRSRSRKRKAEEEVPDCRLVEKGNPPSTSEARDHIHKTRRKNEKTKVVHYPGTQIPAPQASSIYRTIQPCPEIDAEPSYEEYLAASKEKRREMIRKSAVVKKKYIDLNVFREQYCSVRWKNAADPVLSEWSMKHISRDVRGTLYRILGERISEGQPEGADRSLAPEERKWTPPKWLNQYVDTQQYHAPKTRILLTKNLTFNRNDVIPVYCDIKTDSLENLEISHSLTYVYGDVNRIDVIQEKRLNRAINEAMEDENLIRCDCHAPGKALVPCYENEECPCYQTNKAMQKLQVSAPDAPPTKFSTLKPILCNTSSNPFYEFVGFACSDSCSCKGQCTNNALYLSEKRNIPLEIYRSDPNIGFGMRSPVLIPAGTPFVEFVGEITEEKNLMVTSQDYAYRVTYDCDNAWQKFVKTHKKWTKSYGKLLADLNKETFYCNPKYYGNVGRTALHSCIANVEIFRVYQKSLSPAHARLVMISLEDISPGVPITLDYGKNYVKTQLNGICKCGTFACHNGKHFDEFAKLNNQFISMCLIHLNTSQIKHYNETIVKKVAKQYNEKRKLSVPAESDEKKKESDQLTIN